MENTTKHTPGPWKIGYGGMDGDNFGTITSNFAEYPICQLEPRGYNQDNARLIAAAPDLLAACVRLVACPDVNQDMLSPETLKALDNARAAIAKAKAVN